MRLGHAEAGSRLLAAHEAARRNAIATEAKRVVWHTSQLEVAIAAEARRYAAEAQNVLRWQRRREAAEAEAQATAANVRSRVEALVQATDAIVDSPSKLQTAKGPSDAVSSIIATDERSCAAAKLSPNKKATTSPNARQLSPTAANQALAPSPTADLSLSLERNNPRSSRQRIQEELAQREPLDGDRHRSNGGNVRASAGRQQCHVKPVAAEAAAAAAALSWASACGCCAHTGLLSSAYSPADTNCVEYARNCDSVTIAASLSAKLISEG